MLRDTNGHARHPASLALAIGALGLWGCEVLARPGAQEPPSGDWPVYGGDAGGGRYSALEQIDRSNVGGLEVAWTFRTGELASP